MSILFVTQYKTSGDAYAKFSKATDQNMPDKEHINDKGDQRTKNYLDVCKGNEKMTRVVKCVFITPTVEDKNWYIIIHIKYI